MLRNLEQTVLRNLEHMVPRNLEQTVLRNLEHMVPRNLEHMNYHGHVRKNRLFVLTTDLH